MGYRSVHAWDSLRVVQLDLEIGRRLRWIVSTERPVDPGDAMVLRISSATSLVMVIRGGTRGRKVNQSAFQSSRTFRAEARSHDSATSSGRS